VFKATLEAQLKRIFRLEKVTFDTPGESQEQEGLFVAVSKCKTKVKDGREIALVQGTIHIFSNADKLKYGFFSKALDQARPADTKKLFFFNFEENRGTFRNICERSLDFLYFFDGQFDPALGSITSVDLSLAENL
jgi:hypothetical protein